MNQFKQNNIKWGDEVIAYQSLIKQQSTKHCVVLIHGLGGSSESWAEFITHFVTSCNLIAVDLRSHGLSSLPKSYSEMSPGSLANDVCSIIEKERCAKVIVVGHCYGGMVALEVAERLQGKLQALVLINSAHRTLKIPPSIALPLLKLSTYLPIYRIHHRDDFSKFYRSGDFNLLRLASDIRHTSLRTYMIALIHSITYYKSQLNYLYSTQTLVIEGTKDRVIQPRWVKETIRLLKNAKLIKISTNHVSPITSPKLLAKVVAEFLENI